MESMHFFLSRTLAPAHTLSRGSRHTQITHTTHTAPEASRKTARLSNVLCLLYACTLACILGAGVALGPRPAAAQEAGPSELDLRLVVTFPMLWGLVASVSGPENPPVLLITEPQDPHHADLKPSQIRNVQQASLVFFVSEHFETTLYRKLLRDLPATQGIQLMADSNLKPLRTFGENRRGDDRHPHCRDEAHKHHEKDHDQDDHGKYHDDDDDEHGERHHDDDDEHGERHHDDDDDDDEHGERHHDDDDDDDEHGERHHDDDDEHEGHHDDDEHGEHHRDDHKAHHDDDEHAEHHHGHGHGHKGRDYPHHDECHEDEGRGAALLDAHAWLDVEMAKRMPDRIATELGRLDPANAETYQTRARQEQAQIDLLRTELDDDAPPARLLASHDFLAYAESHLPIRTVDVLSVGDHQAPSLRTLDRIRKAHEMGAYDCFVVEKNDPHAATSRKFAENLTGLQVLELDVLGFDLNLDASHYRRLMTQVAETLRACHA